eukprot:5215649-Alexandrium_andersonii.AAC.1
MRIECKGQETQLRMQRVKARRAMSASRSAERVAADQAAAGAADVETDGAAEGASAGEVGPRTRRALASTPRTRNSPHRPRESDVGSSIVCASPATDGRSE